LYTNEFPYPVFEADSMSKVQARSSPEGGATSGYVLERQVGHLLRRAHQRHAAIFQQHIGDEQLTPLQFAALAKLRDVDEVSQNQLGRMTAMDAATMQGVIKRLAVRRLIRRRPDPGDRRRLILSLSREGRELIDRLVADGAVITALTLEPLSAAEQRIFLDLLAKIAE
jgi:DNA-binding MarR family transcriptional regulator